MSKTIKESDINETIAELMESFQELPPHPESGDFSEWQYSPKGCWVSIAWGEWKPFNFKGNKRGAALLLEWLLRHFWDLTLCYRKRIGDRELFTTMPRNGHGIIAESPTFGECIARTFLSYHNIEVDG